MLEAVENGHTVVANVLIKQKANVNMQDDELVSSERCGSVSLTIIFAIIINHVRILGNHYLLQLKEEEQKSHLFSLHMMPTLRREIW